MKALSRAVLAIIALSMALLFLASCHSTQSNNQNPPAGFTTTTSGNPPGLPKKLPMHNN